MTENPKLENMSNDLRSNWEGRKLGEGGQKICVSDEVEGRNEPDSFVMDMEGLSHRIEKDINANSRITRNLTRKASVRGVEKKVTGNEKDNSTLISSPRATLQGSISSMPEKPSGVAMGQTDHLVVVPQVHHHITITNGCVSSAGAETISVSKRFGFRRSSRAWIVDSRKIFFFFATLSCMGTILLIYFTLSMAKLDGDNNSLN